jgi:hypothetical protein
MSEREAASFDVFVSYCHAEPDASWVRGVLVPRLRAAGLRVLVDVDSFRLGAHVVAEMARSVEESRFTLAVVTPDYLASEFTTFENVLAEHLGLEQAETRLLIVLRQACRPELRLRARLWLDLTDDDRFDPQVTRLVQAISPGRPPERPPSSHDRQADTTGAADRT